MKNVLLLGLESGRVPDIDPVYRQLENHANVRSLLLSLRELKALKTLLNGIDHRTIDNLITDIPFKILHKHARALQRLPGPVIYEEDACQNFIASSKWYGRFSDFYRQLPHAQFVVTGHAVSQRLRALGLNAHFLPKGFDESRLYPTGAIRDIPVGFIGRVRSQVYAERAQLLESLAASHGVSLLRTTTIEEYRNTLNRIGVFVSADIGLGEYMAKNFEAMACGCALLAYRQGDGEEEALGLRDMENVVLYRSGEEAADKLTLLLGDEALRTRIADNGQKLAWQRFRYGDLAENLYKLAMAAPSEVARSPGLAEKVVLAARRARGR